MTRGIGRRTLAGFAALALALSAVGPCHCLLSATACQSETREADDHACCEKPAGVQAVADPCCSGAPELVLASTDVPEVAAPVLQTDHLAMPRPSLRVAEARATLDPPPHPPDRTTVLLI